MFPTVIFLTKLFQYNVNEYSVSTVDTDVLVPKHQDISIHSAEYAPMSIQLFMG